MSKGVENYVDRYIKRHHSRIKQICEPLERCFGINYFTYHSISSDGQWRPLVSRPDWADFYTEKNLFQIDPLMLHPRCYQTGHLLWTHFLTDPEQQAFLKIAREKFGLAHGFCIIEKHDDVCEFFGFNAPPHCEQIYTTYNTHLPLLKQFCTYFKQTAAPLLKLIDNDPINLVDLKGKCFQETFSCPFEHLHATKELFLKFIRSKCPKKLSKREKECLTLYIDEFRMQDVAVRLGLSIRTIESYLTSLKNKLGCGNKAELIKKGRELRAQGIIP